MLDTPNQRKSTENQLNTIKETVRGLQEITTNKKALVKRLHKSTVLNVARSHDKGRKDTTNRCE